MITVRKASERGLTKLHWLKSYHTFSFNTYYDPRHMNFRHLRVINDDYVAAGAGFGTHPHADMEILTWVLQGALEHRDSMGTGSVIRPGEIQRMTAGTGVTHSERNASNTKPVRLLQIWILPRERGLTPGYEQRAFSEEARRGQLCLLASGNAGAGAVTIHQDVQLLTSLLEPGESVSHELKEGRHAWLQAARGAVTLNGQRLENGDGAAISDERKLEIAALEPAEFLLFDLA